MRKLRYLLGDFSGVLVGLSLLGVFTVGSYWAYEGIVMGFDMHWSLGLAAFSIVTFAAGGLLNTAVGR